MMKNYAVPTDYASLVSGPPQGRWTEFHWDELPDDGNRYEIIEGVLYMTMSPSSFHQWIVGRLFRFIGHPAEDQGLGYAFDAPIGVFMPGCDPVQPDFVFVRTAQRAIIGRRIRGVPDLLVEILSPSNREYDETVKRAAYARAGVPEYLIIDPAARTVLHHRLLASGDYDTPAPLGDDAVLQLDCLPTITLSIAQLWQDAPDTTL